MSRLFTVLIIIFPALLEAQEKQLKGRVITDEMEMQSMTVTNAVMKISTETDNEGNFTIPARVNDTLNFTSDLYKPLTVVLKPQDLAQDLFVVRVEPAGTMLDEVVVHGLTGNLAADSKKIKTMQINVWFDPLVINKDIVVQSSMGANWITGVAKLFKKPKKTKQATAYTSKPIVEQKHFSEVVRSSYDDAFFKDTLAISPRFIGAFLSFCDEDAKSYLLMSENEQELKYYLKNKSVEFLKLNPDAR